MKKIASILALLLMGSTATFAQVKVAGDITNGTVTTAVNGQEVTLTATPADGKDCTVAFAQTSWTNAGTYTLTVTGTDT